MAVASCCNGWSSEFEREISGRASQALKIMKPSRSDSLRDEHARGKLRVLVVLVGLWRDAHLGARLLRKHVLTPNAASNVSIALITNTDELCSIKDGVRKRISHSLLGVTSWLLI